MAGKPWAGKDGGQDLNATKEKYCRRQQTFGTFKGDDADFQAIQRLSSGLYAKQDPREVRFATAVF